jgi:hypothetical protein
VRPATTFSQRFWVDALEQRPRLVHPLEQGRRKRTLRRQTGVESLGQTGEDDRENAVAPSQRLEPQDLDADPLGAGGSRTAQHDQGIGAFERR